MDGAQPLSASLAVFFSKTSSNFGVSGSLSSPSSVGPCERDKRHLDGIINDLEYHVVREMQPALFARIQAKMQAEGDDTNGLALVTNALATNATLPVVDASRAPLTKEITLKDTLPSRAEEAKRKIQFLKALWDVSRWVSSPQTVNECWQQFQQTRAGLDSDLFDAYDGKTMQDRWSRNEAAREALIRSGALSLKISDALKRGGWKNMAPTEYPTKMRPREGASGVFESSALPLTKTHAKARVGRPRAHKRESIDERDSEGSKPRKGGKEQISSKASRDGTSSATGSQASGSVEGTGTGTDTRASSMSDAPTSTIASSVQSSVPDSTLSTQSSLSTSSAEPSSLASDLGA